MPITKILLMAPPAVTPKKARDINPLPPMGLGYLAAVVENLGIEVRILDCLVHGWDHEEEVDDKTVRVGMADKEIGYYIQNFNPDLVGVNCQFSRQYKIYHEMFSLIKNVNPKSITVGGGAHVTVCPEEVLNDPCCDFIIKGEAENSFKELTLAIIKGGKVSSIDGLGWKKNGKITINEKRKWITDLDSIPFPAYHLMELEKYFGSEMSHGLRHKKRFCPVITSRGCPAKCTFCTARRVWGERYRMRSVGNILEEMRLLKGLYGIEEILFEDDNVTANPKRAKELFAGMIEGDFNFIWDTPNGVGVWSVDEEMLELMQKSGCINLNFPVESGSQWVLDKIIRKPLKLDKVKKLVEHCKKIRLGYSMFLVIGMPGETIADMWQSFRFAADCGCYMPHISVATPYPGSQLFVDCQENGYFSKEFSLDDLYIRSFVIRTKDWSERDLQRTLFKGNLFLKCRMLLDDPRGFLRWLLNGIKKRIKALVQRRRYVHQIKERKSYISHS